jgi:hypothetical protein
MTMRVAIFASVFALAVGAASAQPTPEHPAWLAVEQTGPDPLATRHAWTNAETGANLSMLLGTPEIAASDRIAMRPGRDYIVLVAALNWNDTFLVRHTCLEKARPFSLSGGCDFHARRLVGSRSVSIVAISAAGRELAWDVIQRRRQRLDALDFLSFVLPTLGGALIARPDPEKFMYALAVEDLTVDRVPEDIEIKATAMRAGGTKESAFGATFNNYNDEYLSFGIGVGVRKTDDVSVDLANNFVAARDISKLKTYGLVNLHVPKVDPFSLRAWQWPHVFSGIEVSSSKFNYGVGAGWRLPFVKNTALAWMYVHALPDTTDQSKGARMARERRWKSAYLVQYAFQLTRPEKK